MKDKFNKKYIIITKDLHENLIEFLDEIQFDIAGDNDKESMHKVNFISWAINELLNSYEAFFPKQKKSRQDYVDETFMDWNLPEMSDEDYNKLVDQVDNFLKGWEKEYKKSNPKKKTKSKKSTKLKAQSKEKFVPPLEDVVEYMSLDEIKDYLLDDPELSDEERFDLYYEERERIRNKGMSYDELLKKSGLKPPIKN